MVKSYNVVMVILVIVGQKYPQALYYSLRAFLLERRESSAAAAAEAAQPSSSSVASSAAASSSSESGEAKNGMDVEDDQSNTSKTSSGVASGGAASGAARVGSSAGSTHHANELMSWLRRGHLGLVTDTMQASAVMAKYDVDRSGALERRARRGHRADPFAQSWRAVAFVRPQRHVPPCRARPRRPSCRSVDTEAVSHADAVTTMDGAPVDRRMGHGRRLREAV